jgi:hypothetical protein
MSNVIWMFTCCGFALAGCTTTDEGAAQATVSDSLWVAPFASPIDMAWMTSSSDCLPEGSTCYEYVPFRVTSIRCDGCDVGLLDGSTLVPTTPNQPTRIIDEILTVYAIPNTIGAVTFSADLESTFGARRTVTLDADADRVNTISTECVQTRYVDDVTGPCGATRKWNDEVVVTLSATTEVHGVTPITPTWIPATLPTMSPDAANWGGSLGKNVAMGAMVPPNSTALSETLSWTVSGQTLTSTVTIPPLAK